MFELSYMGGFFDGEGCITIIQLGKNVKQKTPHYKCKVSISNTNREVLEIFKKNFGGTIHIVPENKEKNRKKLFQWKVEHFSAYQFCLKMQDCLIIKRRNAELIIEYYEKSNPREWITSIKEIERRKKLVKEIKKLNFRGVNK